MALITKPHALPDQRKSLFPGEIPSDATHLVWFRWEDGTTVVQFADTKLSAVRRYGIFNREFVGRSFILRGTVREAGWNVIDDRDRRLGIVL